MPNWVKQKPFKRYDNLVSLTKGSGKVSNILHTSRKIAFTIESTKSLVLQINTIYWPGWEAASDGVSVPISYNNPCGVMMISVPKGNHKVVLSFEENQLRLFSNILSVTSFLILLFFIKRFPAKK